MNFNTGSQIKKSSYRKKLFILIIFKSSRHGQQKAFVHWSLLVISTERQIEQVDNNEQNFLWSFDSFIYNNHCKSFLLIDVQTITFTPGYYIRGRLVKFFF